MINRTEFLKERSESLNVDWAISLIVEQIKTKWDGYRAYIGVPAELSSDGMQLVISEMMKAGWSVRLVPDQGDGDYLEVL